MLNIVLEIVYISLLYSLWKGCPIPGYYGEDCSLPCPQNCQGGHCHIADGTCLGCVAGFTGRNCNERKWWYITVIIYVTDFCQNEYFLNTNKITKLISLKSQNK